MKHFVYTKKIKKQDGTELGLTESFDLSRVIRSVRKSEEVLTVLLDDGHEESIEVPIGLPDQKNKQKTERRRYFLSSEIDITGEDITRFFDAITT